MGYTYGYSSGWSSAYSNWTGGDPPQYPIVPGSRLYDEASITGLNRIPVDIIAGYMLSGAKVSGRLPFAIDDLVREQLRSGSIMVIGEALFQDIFEAGPDEVHRLIYPTGYAVSKEPITRVYRRTPVEWVIQNWERYGTDDAKPQGDPVTAALTDIYYYYNAAAPLGVIMPSQHTYRRLEEIERGLRTLQSGPAVKTIVSGHVRNRDEAELQLNSDKRVVFLPGGETGVKVDKTGDTAAVDQMLSEYNQLIERYWQQTHIVDMTGQVQRPSSTDRKLTLGPMMRFVERQREITSAIVAEWGGKFSYEPIHTTDIAERITQLELYNQLLSLGVITRQQFQDEASKLI